MNIEDIDKVEILQLKKGDIIVLHTEKKLPQAVAVKSREILEDVLKKAGVEGVQIMITDSFDVKVIRQETVTGEKLDDNRRTI